MGHISNDEFFVKLEELFERRRGQDHGSVFLTQKRYSWEQDIPAPATDATTTTILPDLHPPRPLPIIIRATDGKQGLKKEKRKSRVKLSTIVEADALPAFFDRYAEVCKVGMAKLKPRDRSKRKTRGKKKKGGAAPAPAPGA